MIKYSIEKKRENFGFEMIKYSIAKKRKGKKSRYAVSRYAITPLPVTPLRVLLTTHVGLKTQIFVVYHLPKNSGNFGWNVNGKTVLVCPNGNFPK